jgi:hypothetical protein
MKKNKTWDGDGVLVLEDRFLALRDMDGKKYARDARWVNGRIGTKIWMTGTLSVGDTLKIGNKDIVWTMVDFVNPGLLDTYAKFKREFEGPIVRGRQPGGTQKVVEMGVARGEGGDVGEDYGGVCVETDVGDSGKVFTDETYLLLGGWWGLTCRWVCGVLCTDGVATTGL